MTSRRMRFILLGGLIVLLISLWANSQSPSPRSTPPKGVTPTAPSADKLQAVPPMRLTQQDIGDVFLIITDLTGWNIIPTTEVSRAKVSLWTNSITPDELLDQVVKLAGFVHHREGNTISVMTYDEYIQHYGVAKKVMGMKYAKADSVAEVIKPFLTKLGKIVVHKETHTLVLYEVPANLETLVGIVQELDTPTENITIEVVGLKYTDAQDLAQILEKAFTDSKRTERNRSSPTPSGSATQDTRRPTEAQAGLAATLPSDHMAVYAVRHANQLVIVGTSEDIRKALDLIKQVDIPSDSMVVEVIQLEFADAEVVGRTLQELFSGTPESRTSSRRLTEGASVPRARPAVEGAGPEGALSVSPYSQIDIRAVGRTNQLILKGFRGDLDKVKELIHRLDVFVEPMTQTYHFTYVDASQVSKGLDRVLDVYGRTGGTSSYGTAGQPLGRDTSQICGITLIERTNSILLTGPPSAHRIMSSICESIDVPGTYEAGMIRVYKIQNADVEEIAQTLEKLLASKGEDKPQGANETRFLSATPSRAEGSGSDAVATTEFVPQVDTQVSVNKATNSIVVQATVRQHREIERLLAELDVRRKQVLLEAMIVEVTQGENMDLGAELSYINRKGGDGAFSSFGLSKLNFSTGAVTEFGGTGGTVAVLDPTSVQAVIRALQTTDNIKIHAVPQILVNDNEIGNIHSITEEPTRQTNMTNTTSVTSFGEYVTAGTQFKITPHISESDYLHVEYEIELSSFGEKADSTLPPTRSTSKISSKATVPDGHTIVVGGIRTAHESKSVDKVPLLGDIPLLGMAFRNKTTRRQHTTTYLFITPTIMKNADFTDLQGASEKALSHADVEPSQNRGQPFQETDPNTSKLDP